jgi:manganese oxidase
MRFLRGVLRSRAARLAVVLATTGAVASWAVAATAGPPRGAAEQAGGGQPRVRTYYIAADQVVWDYAPAGRNLITGKPFGAVEQTYVASGEGRIGSRYVKCLYRGYTDGSFHTLSRRADEAYLGTLGPVIRAAVGDTIRVVFRNRCAFANGLHPHGVFYDKADEGAPYADDDTDPADAADDAVPPGHGYTYTWQVPDRAGPGPMDGSSVLWMYHSHTDEVADVYAGLIGPMEITRRGLARPDGSPRDVDRELFTLFLVGNENASPYLPANLHRFAKPPYPSPDDEDFEESNLMHSINGYVYGNQPMPTVRIGQHVRWYTMSMGTEVDLHTPHWHGNTVTVNGMRTDTIQLLPAGMVTADMTPDNPGTWLFHCHVADHITAGMLARYRVVR